MSSSQNRKLGYQVNIGLTEHEAIAVDRAARASNTSRASFVRRHLLSVVKLPETRRPRRYATMSSADIEAVAELIAALGRATGATVQLAKELRRANHVDQYKIEKIVSRMREQSNDAATIIERMMSDQR